MKLGYLLLLSFLISGSLFFSANNLFGQQINPGNEKYILHQVQEGESVFSLCKLYNVGQKELIAANPSLLFGLKPGTSINIPISQQAEFIEHKVRRRQTIFSIARQYEITLEELYKYNPSAKNGIENGQILLIPTKATLQIAKIQKKVQEQKKEKQKADSLLAKQVKYFRHKILEGETFFDLKKRYGISQDSLQAINPVLKNGIVNNITILIPDIYLPEINSKPINENEFLKHTVKADQTIYDLATLYNTKVSEIKNANPELEYRELIDGEELFIPDKKIKYRTYDEKLQDSVWIQPSYAVEKTYKYLSKPCVNDSLTKERTYQVALMLPLFLEANDTINRIPVTAKELLADSVFMSTYDPNIPLPKDTFIIREEKIIDPRSENFMHLYEGVLLAVDSLRKQGVKLELFVYDTNRDSLVIDSLIQLDEFREMDLIIGPVYPNLQKNVSAFSAKNRIPMVSPLSSGGKLEYSNPYYFKINPTKDYLIKETANWLTDEFFDKNFIVFQMGDYQYLPEAKLVDLCKEKLYSTGYYDKNKEVLYHEYDFPTEGFWGLQRILSRERENVFIIPAINEGQVSVAVTNLNTLSEQAPVRLIGLSGFRGYRSIQPEYYHRAQLKFLTHYFIDLESIPVNRFIASFKKQFATEPNEFSFHGFDLAYYFMNALYNFGKDMVHCLPTYQVKLNQLNLDFQRVSETGGFMNYGLYKVGYEPDFNIKNYGTYSSKNLLPYLKK